MTPEEQAALDQEAYASAFDEDMRPDAEPDDFEIPDEPGNESEAPAAVAVVIEPASEEVTEDMVKEPVAEEEANAAPADDKEIQRQKSWEGRLRAREAELNALAEELKAKEEALKKPAEETPAHEDQESAVQEAAEQVADRIEEGVDSDEAMRALAEDFGEDFVKTLGKLIEKKAAEIAGKAVDERVGKVSQSVNELVQGISNDKARSHFEAIQDAHPDFDEIANGSDLQAYVAALPDEQKAKAEGVIQGGSARQVIRLLNDFKKSRATPEPQVDEATVAAAEGVRSRGGMKLPEKPAASNDYASAWEDF
jgi:myosin heavy subunit